MKKIFTYMTLMAAVILTACSDDDIAQSSTKVTSEDMKGVTGTITNVAEFEEGEGNQGGIRSKAQDYYDRVAGKLKFTWIKPNFDYGEHPDEYKANVDHIGIFAAGNPNVQLDFMLNPDKALIIKETTTTGMFISADGAVNPINGGKTYYSYYPYTNEGVFNATNVPISFRGQVQTANEQMGYYFKNTTEADVLFLASEKEAAAHLGKYDFMVSDGTAAADNEVKFYFTHVGSIVRFYMTCPSTADENMFYDSLQVYNSQANFTLDATMNLATKELTPTKTSHVMSLGFHPAIDMTCNNKHESSDPDEKKISWYWKENGLKGYIMAYMMVAPINLREITESPTLYLIGRKASYYTYIEYKTAKGDDDITEATFNALPKIQKMKIYENLTEYNEAHDPDISQDDFDKLPASDKMKDYERKVYKAELVKLKLEAGKHHQWVPAASPDSPIEFQNISIQEWENYPGFTNKDGAGTEDW